MNKLERFVSQVTSGRWLLTQVAAVCLFMLVLSDCYVAIKHPDAKVPFSIEGIMTLISSVFISYFAKPGDKPEVTP